MSLISIVFASLAFSLILFTESFTVNTIFSASQREHCQGFPPCFDSNLLATKQNSSNDDSISRKTKKQITKPSITVINGLDEFLEFLAESDDRIVVVEFYAAWCKSCHKFGVKYKQLASKYGDKINDNDEVVEKGQVRFAQVEYGANVRLCKTFGIKKLPFVQMYKAVSDFVTFFMFITLY
jgi:thiol-disulfide isomerase/thioredoxin